MVNLNKNNTIIENVEYLDMDDPKNSWYFDAERFDVNFPLVCSYKGGEKAALFLHGWFTYWNHVFSYYRRDQDITALLVDRKSTRLNSSHVRISYAVFCLKKKKIKKKH